MGMHSWRRRRGAAKPAVLGVVLLLALGAAVWLWLRPGTQPGVDAGRSVAGDFLQSLQQGQPDQAWESTTAEFKSAQGKESFVRDVAPARFLRTPLEFVSVQTVSVGDEPRSEYLYRAATGETVRIVLGREAGAWKVDRWTR
jgi:hypothetical protein